MKGNLSTEKKEKKTKKKGEKTEKKSLLW